MFDLEREQTSQDLSALPAGFMILGVALGLACFDSLLDLFARFQPAVW